MIFFLLQWIPSHQPYKWFSDPHRSGGIFADTSSFFVQSYFCTDNFGSVVWLNSGTTPEDLCGRRDPFFIENLVICGVDIPNSFGMRRSLSSSTIRFAKRSCYLCAFTDIALRIFGKMSVWIMFVAWFVQRRYRWSTHEWRFGCCWYIRFLNSMLLLIFLHSKVSAFPAAHATDFPGASSVRVTLGTTIGT